MAKPLEMKDLLLGQPNVELWRFRCNSCMEIEVAVTRELRPAMTEIACPICKRRGQVPTPQEATTIDVNCAACAVGFRVKASDPSVYLRRPKGASVIGDPKNGLYDPAPVMTTSYSSSTTISYAALQEAMKSVLQPPTKPTVPRPPFEVDKTPQRRIKSRTK